MLYASRRQFSSSFTSLSTSLVLGSFLSSFKFSDRFFLNRSQFVFLGSLYSFGSITSEIRLYLIPLWSDAVKCVDTCHSLICVVISGVDSVMSITSCLPWITNVGELPLFSISRFVEPKYSSKDSPLVFIFVLP